MFLCSESSLIIESNLFINKDVWGFQNRLGDSGTGVNVGTGLEFPMEKQWKGNSAFLKMKNKTVLSYYHHAFQTSTCYFSLC